MSSNSNLNKDFIIAYPIIVNDVIRNHVMSRTNDMVQFLGNIAILNRNCIFNGYYTNSDVPNLVYMVGVTRPSGRGVYKYFNMGDLPMNKDIADAYIITQIKEFLRRFCKLEVNKIDLMELSIQIYFKDGSIVLLAFNSNPDLHGLNKGCLIDIENGSAEVMKAFNYTPRKAYG